jgi:hypothetical protein
MVAAPNSLSSSLRDLARLWRQTDDGGRPSRAGVLLGLMLLSMLLEIVGIGTVFSVLALMMGAIRAEHWPAIAGSNCSMTGALAAIRASPWLWWRWSRWSP